MPQLTIGLTEPTIFLRRSNEVTASGRRRQMSSDAPPAVLRGLLTLKLTAPMKIKDIKVFLEGKTVTEWPEGIGPRHNQFEDETQILAANATVFKAQERSADFTRRTRSLGPGVFPSHESDDSDDEGQSRGRTRHLSQQPSVASVSSSRSQTPERRRQRRGISMDQWGRHGYPAVEESAHFVPSPMYTAEELPEQPSQALEVLRNALQASTNHLIPAPGQISRDGRRLSRPNTSNSRSRPASMQRSTLPFADLSPSPSRLESRIDEHTEETSPNRIVSGPSPATSPVTTRRPSFTQSIAGTSSPRTLTSSEFSPPLSPRISASEDHLSKSKQKRFSFSAAWQDVKDKITLPSVRRPNFAHDLPTISALTPRSATSHTPLPANVPLRDISRGRIPPQRETSRGRAPPVRESSRGRDQTVIGKLGGVLGLEDGNENWEELRKGTYNWPVSFTIPADSPPSLRCDYGTVKYRLCAEVNRPGAFHGKLTASADVTVIACPGEDDTEESESIVVEREWEQQLRYLIVISGKSFPIGGTIPLHITLMPMSKMSLYRINVVLEEKVSYFAHGRAEARHEPIRRQLLLGLRHPDKHSPLLPIFSNSADAASSSVLAPFVEADNVSEVAEHLLTLAGPWAVHFTMKVPNCTTKIHFTNKYSNAKISVSHVIKVTLRVDRGDGDVDAKGKRKQFDIIIECPVQLLSCRCNSEWINLPTYSSFPLDTQQQSHGCVCRANIEANGSQVQPNGLHDDMTFDMNVPLGRLPVSRPPLSNSSTTTPPNAEVAERSEQFARLVAGAESAAGETPP
ncbi:hypothetical protein FRB94_012468, partial [Tulasnella sp. JGI-2019a]